MSLILFLGVGGAINTYYSHRKAELEPSLALAGDTMMKNLRIKEISKQRDSDDNVAFTVYVFNKSEIQAKTVFISLRLCAQCEYVEEPQRSAGLVGAENTDREVQLPAGISALQRVAIPLKVKVPAGALGAANKIAVGITSRCETCTVRRMESLYVDFQGILK
jgi:hypothetical protein